MDTFKYRDLVVGNDVWEPLMNDISDVRSGCLRECTDAFTKNLCRLASFAFMPAHLSFMSRQFQLFIDNGIFKITGKGNIRLLDMIGRAPTPELLSEFQKQMDELVHLTPNQWSNLQNTFGVIPMEALLESYPALQESMKAMYASVVLGSWTAFECLAADLWVCVVNKGPVELRQKVQLSKYLKRPADTTEVSAPVSGLDPVIDFGGFLREERQVNFQTFPNINKFYSIFCDKQTIQQLFSTNDPYVKALASVRNVLTHKAGIADKSFESQVSNFPELNKFKAGETIFLDGALVKKLKMAAATVGLGLIRHIDGIISPKV